MATGWEPDRISENEIADGEAYHRALYINGDIGSPANWHRESAERLVQLAIPHIKDGSLVCLLYTSPSPRDVEESRMPSSA